jgi:SulP family sulfate permease
MAKAGHGQAGVQAPALGAWLRDFGAAVTGTLASLPGVLTQGLLAYAVLGAAGASLGMPAAFVSVVVGGLVFALLGRGPMPAGAPTAAQVLILASLVVRVTADRAFDLQQPAALAALLALTALAVVGMGLLQISFALAGLVKLAKFVPQPVLAGFMNGVALLILLSQVPALLGWTAGAWATLGWAAFTTTQLATAAVAAFTVLCIVVAPRITTRLPATFIGLLMGTAAYFALAWLAPGAALGPLTGALPQGLPPLDVLAPWVTGDTTGLLKGHAVAAATTAGLLALVGTLALVLDSLAVDQALQTRTDARRELLALGTANIASGVLGGLPVLLHRTRALATARAGGRAPQALLLGTGLYALLALAGSPLLAWLPKVVMGGIMVMVAWSLADQWTHQLVAQWWRGVRTVDMQLNLAVVAVVAVCTIVLGVAAGVALGALLAVALFIRSMNRSLLRGQHTGAAMPSRRIYPPDDEATLQGLRARITVLELEGALFFGSADRLAAQVLALPADCRAVVVDFKRVSVVDASGAVVLAQIAQRLAGRGTTLRLAAVAVGDRHGQALHEFAGKTLSPTAWFADVDQAVEAAERDLLAAAGVSNQNRDARVDPTRSSLMTGLDDDQRSRLAALLQARELAPGERLFRQGDPGDRLYVLSEGSISVVSTDADPNAAPGALRQRYLSLSPGMMLGETALLDAGGRTADAVADTPCRVHSLSRQALQALLEDDPKLCAHVYRNIAQHLSQRLRAAAQAWRASSS